MFQNAFLVMFEKLNDTIEYGSEYSTVIYIFEHLAC